MEAKNYTWTTTFETAEYTVTHVFNDRVKVIFNFRFGVIITVRDGEAVDRFSLIENPMKIKEYETFLLGIAKSAALLDPISHE
jgi:hypothetical protein